MADSDELSTPEDIREAVEDLNHRLETIEDKVMMERLEDLALRDEIEAIEDILDQEGDELRKKLKVLNRVAEEYEGQQFEKKLHFLYNKIQELEKQAGGKNQQAMQERLSSLENRVDTLADTVDQVSSPKEGRDLDDVYDKLHALRDRLQNMSAGGADSVAEEQVASIVDDRLEDVDRRHAEKVQEELNDLEDTVTEQVGELAERIDAIEEQDTGDAVLDDELEDRVEEILTDLESSSVSAAEVNALEDTVADIEEELHTVRDTVDTHTERLDDADEERDAIGEQVNELQAMVDDLEGQVSTAAGGGNIPEQSLLEAIEYTAEQVQRKVEAIDTQIDELHETTERQEERIDGVSSAQNIFESEIGELMERQKELNDEFQEADETISQKLDLLLEAIEEGLAEEQAQIREISRGVEDAVGDAPVDQERVAQQQQAMDHTEVEEPGSYTRESAKVKKLAETALQNQKQIAELQQHINDLADRLDELQSESPTIVE